MTSEIKMPKAGQTMEEGTVLSWEKQPGTAIAEGEIICKIETDKVTMDIEAPVTGVLQAIHVQENESVPVGTVIATVVEKT